MKITRREAKLLGGTVAFVAIVLAIGTWWSAGASGRYRLMAYGTLPKEPIPKLDIRLRPNGEWFMVYPPSSSWVAPKGTYTIHGGKITLITDCSDVRCRIYTGSLTEGGFVLPAPPGRLARFSKPVTYTKISSIDIF